MQFSWIKNIAKAFWSALVTAVLLSIGGIVSAAFSPIESPAKLLELGVPAYLIPFVAFAVTSLLNYIKQNIPWLKSKLS